MKYILETIYLQFQYDVAERGILRRIEPSTKNPVTSSDLTIRFNHELLEEGHSLYQPAVKINLGAVYDIKKDDKILKSWNVNGALDLKNGHMLNSLKLEVTKSVPGEDDYKICIQGKETYSMTDLSADMTITMGSSTDGKCNKDGGLIEFVMFAQRLSEQQKGLHNYEVCSWPMTPLIDNFKPYSCYADRSSLRKYAVYIKTSNFPSDFETIIVSYWTMFLAKYYDNYEHSVVTSNNLPADNLKLELWYPISKDIIDMKITTPEEIHKFNGLQAKEFEGLGIYPDNLLYGNINYITHSLGLTDICIIDENDLKNNVSDDWILLLSDSEPPNVKYGLWIKLLGHKLTVKITTPAHTLIITPSVEEYIITLDETVVTLTESMYHENFGLTKMEDSNTLVYFGRRFGGVFVYDGYHLLLELPKIDVKLYGKCLEMKQ